MEPETKRPKSFCIGCRNKDDTITHHAQMIAKLKMEKLAYRAALMEVLSKDQAREILTRHMERLEV